MCAIVVETVLIEVVGSKNLISHSKVSWKWRRERDNKLQQIQQYKYHLKNGFKFEVYQQSCFNYFLKTEKNVISYHSILIYLSSITFLEFNQSFAEKKVFHICSCFFAVKYCSEKGKIEKKLLHFVCSRYLLVLSKKVEMRVEEQRSFVKHYIILIVSVERERVRERYEMRKRERERERKERYEMREREERGMG